MEFDEIWETLLTRKSSSILKELPELLILEDSFSSKEYYLTHMYQDSFYEFQGLDSENNSYHIRMLPLQSFDDVKTAFKNFSMLRDHTEAFHLIPIKNIFEIYDNQWVLVIVSESLEGLTLGEISDNLETFSLPKELGVMAYTRLIEIIVKSYEAGIILNISPETIVVYKQDSSDPCIYSTEASRYNIKLLTSSQLPRYSKNKFEVLFQGKRNSLENEIWGAALLLFLYFSKKKLEDIINLKDMEEDEKVSAFVCSDSVVSALVLSSLKSQKSSVLASPAVKIWKLFLDESWDQLVDLQIKDISPLLTVLKFETNTSLLAATKKILAVANDFPGEVSKAFSSFDSLIEFFVIIKTHVDFYKYPALINPVLVIFKEKISSCKVKQGLINAGFLSLIDEYWLTHAKSDLVCKFVIEFIDNSTLTILQILWDKGFIDSVLKKPVKSSSELEFIKLTISFYGPNSIAIAEKCAEMPEFTTLRLLQCIYEIPANFKVFQVSQVLCTMRTLTKRSIKSNDDSLPEMIKSLIFNLNEIFLVPEFIHKQHLKGSCTNQSSNKFLEIFSKNPLIIRCSECSYTCCMPCFDSFHKNHEHSFQLNSVFRCAETTKAQSPAQVFSGFESFPQVSLEIEEIQTDSNDFRLLGKTFVSKQNLSPPGNDAYFEVFIGRNSSNEKFFFGICGTGIIYRGDSGVIMRNGHPVGLGPKLGSYDTAGVGLKDKKVFFTYNGLLLRPFYDCFVTSAAKVYFGYSSEDPCDVKVKTQDMLFQSFLTNSFSETADCNTIINFIFRKIKKLQGEKDPRARDLVDKFLELVFSLKKEEIHAKVLKMLQNF